MAELLRWRQPEKVLEESIKQGRIEAKLIVRTFCIGYPIALVIACLVSYILLCNWHTALQILRGFLFTAPVLFFMGRILLSPPRWLETSASAYWFTEHGISINGSTWGWKRMASVCIYDDKDIVGVKVLDIDFAPLFGKHMQLKAYFDPSEVSESDIRDIVDKYAPGKLGNYGCG